MDYILIRNFDEELLSSGTLKNEAILLINPYWQHVDREAAVEKVSKWYDLSEQKVSATKQGSIIYYNMTLKK